MAFEKAERLAWMSRTRNAVLIVYKIRAFCRAWNRFGVLSFFPQRLAPRLMESMTDDSEILVEYKIKRFL